MLKMRDVFFILSYDFFLKNKNLLTMEPSAQINTYRLWGTFMSHNL